MSGTVGFKLTVYIAILLNFAKFLPILAGQILLAKFCLSVVIIMQIASHILCVCVKTRV